jgi:hypothetical protein
MLVSPYTGLARRVAMGRGVARLTFDTSLFTSAA